MNQNRGRFEARRNSVEPGLQCGHGVDHAMSWSADLPWPLEIAATTLSDERLCRLVRRVQPRDELGRGEWLLNELEGLRAEIAQGQLVIDIARTHDDPSVRARHQVVVDQLARASAGHDAVGHQDSEFCAVVSDNNPSRFDIAHLDDAMAGPSERLGERDTDVSIILS